MLIFVKMKKFISLVVWMYFTISVMCKYEICSCRIFDSTIDMIDYYGYKTETHHVITYDGYILELHRIPTKKNNAEPIFLQHGLLGSSSDWVITGFKSLPFLLNEMGYDVWLGNSRGNTFSRNHTKYSNSDWEFWQFSWHEMGIYDLPACFDYIYKRTQRKMVYIGHSMGTTMSFVLFSNTSLQERYSRIIKKIVALAPVAYMTNVKTPFKNLAYVMDEIKLIERILGINQFLPQNPIFRYTSKAICKISVYRKMLCENFIFLLTGFDKDEFDPDLLPCILNYVPAGTSTNTVIHFGQEILDKGHFKMFDYGKNDNWEKYNSSTPPLYNLTSIKIPIRLFYSLNDWLSNYKDVEKLASDIGENVKLFLISDLKFNHIDFLWGKHAKELVYNNIFNELKDHKKFRNSNFFKIV